MSHFRFFALMGALAILFAGSACSSEPDEQPLYTVPSTYSFDNVDYSGQTSRLGMLLEMKTYMASANTPGVALDADRLRAMFTNQSPQAGWQGSYDSGRQIKDKTRESEHQLFDQFFIRLAAASLSEVPGSGGQPGVVVSNDGNKRYLLDGNGVEFAQFIKNGLLGAFIYHQAVSVYLGEEKMNADNTIVEPGKGTAMAHHWDKAFGYLGVPKAFPADTDGLFFWGTYANRRDPLTGCNRRIMDAMLEGRAAIEYGDLVSRDEAIAVIQKTWEEISAATAINYLNGALDQFDDMAIRAHALSEALAFVYCLKFGPAPTLTLAEIDQVLTLIGGSPNLLDVNLYEAIPDSLSQAKTILSQAFGLENIADEL